MDAIVDLASSYVIAEIVRREPDKDIVLDNGLTEEEVQKFAADGVNPGTFNINVAWSYYTIHIIDTIFSGDSVYGDRKILDPLAVRKGQDIRIGDLASHEYSGLRLEPGMKIVLPITSATDKGVPYEHSYCINGLYYIVDDHFVLSAFNEMKDNVYSGYSVEQLADEILRMRGSSG